MPESDANVRFRADYPDGILYEKAASAAAAKHPRMRHAIVGSFE
jgi:hypothetical protein